MPPPSETDESSLRYPGWRVVGVCFAMAVVCWGFGFYGHAFYLAELRRLHGWPTAVISSATTAYYFISAVLVAFISDAVRRLGARACVLIGAGSFAASVAALPFITEPAHLLGAGSPSASPSTVRASAVSWSCPVSCSSPASSGLRPRC